MSEKEVGIKIGRDHAQIGKAANIPVSPSSSVISMWPIIIPAPARAIELQVRVSAPTVGQDLPIILLSHGGGTANTLSSMKGMSPLSDFWAGHGFVCIQPTHLSSKALNLDSSTTGFPDFWQSRVEDMKNILDHFDVIETTFPAVKGRVDKNRIAVVGHSMGGHTVSMILGAELTDDNGRILNMADSRISAGILLASTGAGGDHLSPAAAKLLPLRSTTFNKMKVPALVVIGDKDDSTYMTSRGPIYHADSYSLSPGPKSLLTLIGGEHLLGGVTGYDSKGTTDENVERVAVVQRAAWAYLRSRFYPGDSSWTKACEVIGQMPEVAKVESRIS